MPDTLRDGKGGGYLAQVDSENRLRTQADSVRFAAHVNSEEGKYYTLTINNTATAADDCIGYIKNTDTDNLVVESIYLFSAAATLLSIKVNDVGTPGGGSDITPVNCNTASNNQAIGTFLTGTDLTGLSGGSTVLNWYVDGTNGKLMDFFPHIIIAPNTTITFCVNQNTQAAIIGLGMYYHE